MDDPLPAGDESFNINEKELEELVRILLASFCKIFKEESASEFSEYVDE